MYNRLKKWMELEGLKPSELASNIGVNRATISHILSNRNKPSLDFIEKLLQTYPNLNSNWLIAGVGSITNQKETKQVQVSKKLRKITVFYDDQSFEELEKERL